MNDYLVATQPGERMLLIGAGALARDIAEAMAPGLLRATFVEPAHGTGHPLGLPVTHDWEQARSFATHYILGLLDLTQRRRLQAQAEAVGLLPASPLVSRHANVSPLAALSPGCVIGNNVQLGAGSCIGQHGLVMHNAVVGHDVTVGDNCIVLPGAWLGGYVRVGHDCLLGANSVVSPRLNIGNGCVLAPGAACLRSIAACSTVIGNPARIVRMVPGG